MDRMLGTRTQALLAAPLTDDEDAALLAELGLTPDQQNAILLGLVRKAREGDYRSIQLVHELAGQGGQAEAASFAADLRRMTNEELERMLGE